MRLRLIGSFFGTKMKDVVLDLDRNTFTREGPLNSSWVMSAIES